MKKLLLLITLLFITISCKESNKVDVNKSTNLPVIKKVDKRRAYNEGDIAYIKSDSLPVLIKYRYDDSLRYDITTLKDNYVELLNVSYKAFY